MLPRVTYLMMAYNDERFIGEALDSALRQDYGNLEIFVADDCSTDRTFDVIRQKLAGYVGSHRVVVERNDVNIGALQSFHRTMGRVSGEFIIMGHGDDTSVPHRVSRIMDIWRDSKLPVMTSNCYIIDESGANLGIRNPAGKVYDTGILEFARNGVNVCCYGAAMSFSRVLYERFGPVDSALSPINADHIIPAWGLLAGGNGYIPEPLMYHRRHSASITQRVLNFRDRENLEESNAAHNATQALYALNAFIKHRDAGCGSQELNEAITLLAQNVLARTQLWVRTRNALINRGYSYTWYAPKQ